MSNRCEATVDMSGISGHCGEAPHRCNNQTNHESRRCAVHRPKPKPARAVKPKPEFFIRTISSSVGRMYDETPIKTKGVYLRMGDSEVELEWSAALNAFSIRTTHKGLRDGMTIIPDCSNRVFIRVGEQ